MFISSCIKTAKRIFDRQVEVF